MIAVPERCVPALSFDRDQSSERMCVSVLCKLCRFHYKKILEIEPETTYHGQLYTIVNDEVDIGEYRFNLGIGDRISSFVTEESGVKIKIEP